MISRLTELFKRAKKIFQTEGLIPLAKRGFPFVLRSLVRYRTYYLYEFALEDIRKLNEADFMPRIDNFTLKIVSTNQEADELEARGLEFRSQVINARERLDKGAIAFCIFVERELANIGWVAMTQQAKDSLSEPPYDVEFSKGEVCGGNVWTNPKYRRLQFSVYYRFKRYQFLLEKGWLVWQGATPKANIATQRGVARFSPKVYAEARYLKILWWKSWKEKPLT